MALESVYADVVSTSYVVGWYDELDESYDPVVQKHLPPGIAWRYAPDGDYDGFVRAIGYSFARVEKRGEDLLKEIDPSTMFELLADWERVLDLPGTNPSPPTTLAGRRDAVRAKLVGHGDPSIPNLEEIADGAGYESVVVGRPFEPFVAGSTVGYGFTGGGRALWNNNQDDSGWSFVWLAIQETGSDDALVQWLLESVSPRHTEPLFTFFASAIVDELFDSWSGDTPTGWTKLETSPGDVSEVGSGEGNGGSGSGAVNLYSTSTTGVAAIILASPTVVVSGEWYICVCDVSYIQGVGTFFGISDFDTPAAFYVDDISTVGRHWFLFQANDANVQPVFGCVNTVGNVTVDRFRILGPIDLF